MAVPDKEEDSATVPVKMVARQEHHDANQRVLPGYYTITVLNYLSWGLPYVSHNLQCVHNRYM
jgi:hypothetical protein